MPLDTVNSLVDALRTKPILRPEQVQELLTKYAPAHPDTQDLARTLIRLRWLTIYQAKKLVAGKADDLVLGQYVILDKLGEGGMGRVFKAVQLSLNRPVALKVVRNSLLNNETALKRFRREVRSAAQLSHPNIVRVFDADQVNRRHFLAMEYMDGVDLGRLVKDRGPLPIAMACSYVRQAALGLQHAHDRHMIHRDVKPANLLVGVNELGEYGVRSVVKVLDMGLARFRHAAGESTSTDVTRANTVVGTPDFMSPEQAKDSRSVDHQSDLYSLGCTLYFLLTGEPPFPKGHPLEKLMQHQMDAPRPVQSLRADIPNEVAAVVHCLMSKRPEDRFQSGAALAHALEPWCATSPTAPASPTMVLPAEAVDPDSVSLETDPNDPFDFGDDDPGPRPPTSRRPPPLPRAAGSRPKPGRSLVVPLLVVFLVFLVLGAVGVGVLLANRKKPDDPPPAKAAPPRTEVVSPGQIAKADPPPAKELEAVEKYLPDGTSLAAVFDVRQLQASPVARKVMLGPVADELAPFRVGVGIDLPSLVERVVVGVGPEERGGALVVLQGRGLVTPKLTDAIRGLARRNASPAWDGGPDVFPVGVGPSFLATTETGLLISARRELVVEALEKADGVRRTTRFTDPTIGPGFEVLNRPGVQLAAFGRAAAIQLVVGLRQRWQEDHPAAARLNALVGLVVFDDRGMHLHALADETEVGKTHEFLRGFGRSIGDPARASTPPDRRLERIGMLLTDAEPALKGLTPKRPYVHLVSTVPPRRLDDWFVPFLPTKPDR
jgi:serine/threonine-protein kinase